MASSETRPNYARRFFWFAVLIVLAIVAYSAGWFYIAGQVDARAASALDALDRNGVDATCANRDVRGYPFRIGLYCDDVVFTDDARGVALSAGAFRSAAQIYDPRFLIGELDGPAQVQAGNGLPPLELNWEAMRASARLTASLPERLSVESRDFSVATAAGEPLVTIGTIETHLRPNAEDLDLALSFTGLAVDETLIAGRDVPPMAGQADLSVTDGAALAVSGDTSLRGRSGTIRNARIDAGGASIALSGPFAIDANGIIDAQLELSVQNPQELSALLSRALPELADQVEILFSGLAAMGDTPTLPLTISQGRVSIAFLDLGEIPPL